MDYMNVVLWCLIVFIIILGLMFCLVIHESEGAACCMIALVLYIVFGLDATLYYLTGRRLW